MGRPPKRQRASEGEHGTLIHAKRRGKVYDYLRFAFPVPEWAFYRWPGIKWRKDGRIVRQFPVGRELDGEAWVNMNLQAIHAGTWVPPQIAKTERERDTITFREYAGRWVEDRRKPNGDPLKETTKQKYRESLDYYLYDYFGDMPLNAIRPKDVQAWWDTFTPLRADTDMADRRAHVYQHLKSIMRSAATEPINAQGDTLIASSPCRIRAAKPKRKHVPVRPTPEQLDALMAALPAYVMPVARICDGAGLREAEALGLCVKHIDFDRMRINVEQQVQRIPDPKRPHRYMTAITTPKTDTSIAEVPMSPALAGVLREWIESHGLTRPEQPLFTGPRTKTWISPQTYRNAIADAREKVPGLETMRPHDLRKDCLSRLLEGGATVSEVMRQGRHATLDVASLYQVPSDAHMADVLRRVDRLTEAASAGPDGPDPSPRDGTATDGGDGDVAALAGVLAGMDAAGRLEVLRALPAGRRAGVLELLPAGVRAEVEAAPSPGAP